MKLKKEIILIISISVFIIFLEIFTNIITENSVKSVEEKIKDINYSLNDINEMDIKTEEYKNSKIDIENKIKKIKEDWFLNEDKLSYFSEHNELEKVSRCLITLEENVKNEEYEIALEDSSEFIYLLNHIKEKDKIKLKNIF